MSDGPYDVFLSYRRAEGSALAQLVRTELTRRVYRVFMDVRELSAGRFDAALARSIEQAGNFVVLLTPGCLEPRAGDVDWFQREIQHALGARKKIVPLKAENFQFPTAGLSAAAAQLAKLHCVTYVHEHSDASLDKLCSLLRRPRGLNRRRWLVAGLVAAGAIAAAGAWSYWNRTPPSQPVLPPPRPTAIDLLARVDVKRDRIRGDWIAAASTLAVRGGERDFGLVLPWQPPAEYRLRLKVKRLTPNVKSPLVLGLSSGDTRFSIAVDVDFKDQHFAGLTVLDGRHAKGRTDTHKGRVLGRGVPMELVATVRKDRIQLEVNGDVIYDWRGDLKRAARQPIQPTDPLFLGGLGGGFEFQAITLEPLGDDPGSPLQPKAE